MLTTNDDQAADAGTFFARSLTSQAHFELEQERLAGVWTFVGLMNDLEGDGAWFRATLGGRSIFVHRFGNTLRGFENRCAHRHFPIRLQDRGRGPVVCGFHHWRYDRDGRAVGIPMCPEVFGKTPRDLDARLAPVEVEACGSFVFARFPGSNQPQGLRDFLGDSFDILQWAHIAGRRHSITRTVAANWKLLVEIALDDYHLVAVHPSTFGKDGYLKNDAFRYFRFGPHSAHFTGTHETLQEMAAACRAGAYQPPEYRIFNIFPNFAVSIFNATPDWYAFIQQFLPLAPDRTLLRGWFYALPAPSGENSWQRWIRTVTNPVRAQFVRYYINKIGGEDNLACERLQTVASQVRSPALLGSQEERIGWFEETYEQMMLTGSSDLAAAK